VVKAYNPGSIYSPEYPMSNLLFSTSHPMQEFQCDISSSYCCSDKAFGAVSSVVCSFTVPLEKENNDIRVKLAKPMNCVNN
jgi:hypothetical protein